MTSNASSADGPVGAIGNLRFTENGVYADYLLSGQPFIFLSKDWQSAVADTHADLLRTLPSGPLISGLTTAVAPRNIKRRMLYAHHDLDPTDERQAHNLPEHTIAWVNHCELWAPEIARGKSRRRVYWLSLPLDFGQTGTTTAGRFQRAWETVIGRDKDSDTSINHYRTVAADMVRKLPPSLFAKPASVEQIWWHWNYTSSAGAWPHPMPNVPYNPDAQLPGSAFSRVWFDQSAAELRGRRWRAARTDADVFVRTYRERDEAIADSYQALVGIEGFPDTGIQWPHATLFKLLDDLSTADVTLDWLLHLTFDSAEQAVETAHEVITNIKDQGRQRGRRANSDDELVRKLASGKELASELKRGSAERGVNPAVVLRASGTNPDRVNSILSEVIRRYRGQNLRMQRRPGSQKSLWRAFNPGTEGTARLHEIRNPSTTARFAKFVPLLSNKIGNNVGVPLGMNITTGGLPDLVLLDLLGAPGRQNPANLVIGGSPGRGKSQCGKNLERSWLRMGAGLHLLDPTSAREHQRAHADFPDEKKTIIDPRNPLFSLDALRIFPETDIVRPEDIEIIDAGERAVDCLLPLMGFSPMSVQASRLKAILAPGSRATNGIGSNNQLIRYLGDRSRNDRLDVDDDLLIALEGLRAERLLRPLFDESLDLPDLDRQLVIWNFGGLKLPTVTEEYQPHLHHMTTPSQRAAVALYGLASDLAQHVFFNRRTPQPDVLVVEECAAWTHSPGGQKTANLIIRQGRKAWTGFVGISQNPKKDFGVLEDEFIDQRLCLGFKSAAIAEETLRWCGRDVDRHPRLLADYVNNTSPVQMADHGDDSIDPQHGKVIPGREGEAWYLDEFGGFGKVRLFNAPNRALSEQYDTNPVRERARKQAI
ncbi:hypothetical protein GCM10009856_38620 [Mycolicibacterium llatzerense]